MMFKIMYVNNENIFDLYAVLSTFILVIVTSFKAIAFIAITEIN